MDLIGHELSESVKIRELIDQLVGEVDKLNGKIREVKGPNPAKADSAKKMMDQIAKFRGRPLQYPFIGTGAGHGCYVETEDGSVKMDLINGIGVHLFGHGHPRVIAAALRGALSDVVNQGNLEPNREYVQYFEKLVTLAGRKSRLRHAWLSTCGTIANENALKMARQKNGGRMVLSFKNAFAGRSTMMAEVTDNPGFKQGLPEYNEVLRIPFYDKHDPQSGEKSLNALKDHYEKHGKNISCFVFEPMLGEGGYQAANHEFFVPLLDFCKSKGIAIWADEVQTFCRTGELFAFETLAIADYVDLVTIAKTAQVGATLYTEEYNPKPGLVAGTFSGATVAMTTGMEMLDMIVNEGYLGANGRIMQIHKRFVGGLQKLNETTCKGKVQDAGGMGLMVAFTPFEGAKEQADSFMKKLYNNGIITLGCGKGPYRVRFLIPACIEDHDIDVALKIIEKTILEGV